LNAKIIEFWRLARLPSRSSLREPPFENLPSRASGSFESLRELGEPPFESLRELGEDQGAIKDAGRIE